MWIPEQVVQFLSYWGLVLLGVGIGLGLGHMIWGG